MPKILLAVDGSGPSIRATGEVIEASRLSREPIEVELVTVHLPVPKIGGMSSTVITPEMVDDYYRDEGNEALRASESLLKEAGISFRRHILVGNVAKTIVEHALSASCRTIYMGTSGMSALADVVIGSIAHKVVHLSPIPVVLVP